MGRCSSEREINPQSPATWLKPDEPLIGADGRDWSWCYVWFKDVVGFLGYKVEWHGHIWSCLGIESKGYPSINLCLGTKVVRRTLHRLMLEAFVGMRPRGLQCRHIDGNPRNNRLDNIVWGTPKQNQLDRVRHGTQLVGSNVKNSILDEEIVEKIRTRYLEFPNKKRIAIEFGVGRSAVRRAITGTQWAHVTSVAPARRIAREDIRAVTDLQREVLSALCYFTDQADKYPDWHRQWARPIDVGGSNGSHHSGCLARLASKGLADKKFSGGYSRKNYGYRISEAGREALARSKSPS